MKHQKIINLLDSTPNKPPKLRTKNWFKVNDDLHSMYSTNGQIKFKTLMLKLSLSDYSDAYILVTRTITVAALQAGGGKNNTQVVFKNCTPFTNCISKINNTQIDNAKDTDAVMLMYNLIEYRDNYSKNIKTFMATLWRWISFE